MIEKPILTFRIALAALIGAMSLGASPAPAADLGIGGDCCVDLEERIAELEATTARKGTHRVSLTASGYIAQQITWWDDGGTSNTYLHGLGPTQASNIRFNGKAKISSDLTAGYMIRIQSLVDDPFGGGVTTGLRQNADNFSQGLNVQMSFWYVESQTLGKVSVGKQVHAAKSAAMFTDQSGTQVFDNYTMLGGFPRFSIRSGGDLTPPQLTWAQVSFCYAQAVPLGGDCNGLVMNGIRYDTPTIAGFTASASWGEDDMWEAALRYAGEFGGFKVLAGVGYAAFSDENTTGPSVSLQKDTSVFQAGGYVEHRATGLFAHVAFGREKNNGTLLSNGATAPDSHHWYTKAGLRQRWNALGATTVYGTYGEYVDQIGPAALALGVTESSFKRYGGGIAQDIDAAAMTVYAKYQRYAVSVDGPALDPRVTDLDDATFVSAGAIINF